MDGGSQLLAAARSDWPPVLRIAFRYCVTFFAFTTTYLAVGHIGLLVGPAAPFVGPIVESIQDGPAGLMTGYDRLTGLLFGADIQYPTLAGFRAYLITALTVAAAGALIWTVLDRRRREYRRAHGWLRIYLRYFLAAVMLAYGMTKVIPGQFRPPTLIQLITPLGEFTRMRLLWLSMGAATPYIIFTGVCEVLGALLLFSRRTTTLGALILAGSLSNVLALNLSYGIGVQLNVSVYLLMALVLLAPEARRLTAAFFQASPSPDQGQASSRARPQIARATAVVKWLVVIWMIGTYTRGAWLERADAAPIPALYGIYDVEEFVRDGVELARGDAARWQRVVMAERDTAAIQRMTGALQRYDVRVDELGHTLTLSPADGKGAPLTLRYSRDADGRLNVDGNIDGQIVRARLRATDVSQITLRQPLR